MLELTGEMMSRGRVLIIEDEENIAGLVAIYLKNEGFEVDSEQTGGDGLKRFNAGEYRLVLLDLMLPDMDGFDVCREIRNKKNTPVIMLTAKDTEIDKVVGLEIGADDYVTKPFSPRELVARVKSVIRRFDGEKPAPKEIVIGDLRIDAARRTVHFKDREISLTAKEFDLIFYLATNAGIVLSRQQILSSVWGYDYFGDSRTVDVHVNQLRQKLGGDCPITTVWGVGYKIDDKI